MAKAKLRHLVLVLGDQLDRTSAAFDGFDAAIDAVWMAEVREESTHVWSHKARIAVFLAAMRHFRDALRADGFQVHYRELDDPKNRGDFAGELSATVKAIQPRRLFIVEPGEHRVQETLIATAASLNIPLDIVPDRHFFASRDEIAAHARGRKQLRQEFFYRELRIRHNVLMDGKDPVGGAWNYDHDNRGTFGKSGPGKLRPPVRFTPDALTTQVLAAVERVFPDHPGSLVHFDWPVTPADGEKALADFIAHRLPHFGEFQDAMWTDEPYLYHSRFSVAMNLKLLNPRTVVAAAEAAYRSGDAPLAAVEGFIRQILGWREYIRGIYWHFMPKYLERNALKAHQPLPRFYWTGETEMNCLKQALGQTLDYGYAHHIQRLMVTGLFALLLGVEPKQIHEWYLAIYVDAVEWVELPNVLGMSQFADGGLMASKPYIASGKYIQRMSNYCKSCPYDPAVSAGPKACPVTTLYWDFLIRHEAMLARNPRTIMQVKNMNRLDAAEKAAIRTQAEAVRISLL